MAQHTKITHMIRRYTRTDFTALRARLANKLPAATVVQRYYNEDELSERGIVGIVAMDRYLDQMRDDLINQLIDANPLVADTLSRARTHNQWPKTVIDYLVAAADKPSQLPRLNDPVSAWFLPIAAKRLKQDGIATLADLIARIRSRGNSWYRPIPCIGRGKAGKIQNWLRQHTESLGEIPEIAQASEPVHASAILITPDSNAMAPLEKMRLMDQLDGSEGFNRNPLRPLIEAPNDLEAIRSYLYKHRENWKTFRAYQKELERFVLWCIKIRRKALSSISVEDCEAYKDFLANIPDSWIARRQTRNSDQWRPFASQLSASSRKYAITVIRTFFSWAIDVRYLSGNPWAAVSDPRTESSILPIQIDKALPESLWQKLSDEGGIFDQLCQLSRSEILARYPLRGSAQHYPHDAQWRLVRAAVFLIGYTGIRREEAAFATRNHLRAYPEVPGLFELSILGKRAKWRDVFLPARVVDAIEAHWQDRGEDFSFGMSPAYLLSPVILPPTQLSRKKHPSVDAGRGFSVEGIYALITTALKRIASDPLLDLTADERSALCSAGVHALRHTYGTTAVANQVPLDVVQQTLGHTSLQTTTIYTQSEKRRKANELGTFFSRQ